MKVDAFNRCVLATLIFFMGCPASAGPLRDWINHRKATQQEEMLENVAPSNTHRSLPQDVRLLSDIAYGSDAKQRMDVYLPENPTNAPVIFMVHGGAWRFGDKAAQSVVENKIARWVPKGFIFISINYRMLPQTDPLKQAEDVAQALAAAQNKASSWGGNPSKFILMGHSAGAHLVALLAANPSKAHQLGAKPWLGTIALDSAALDLVHIMEAKHYRFYDSAFGDQQTYWTSASPFHALSASANPILAVCSSLRADASCLQAKHFQEKGHSLNIRIDVLEQSLSHMNINTHLGKDGAYTKAVEAFMSSLDATVLQQLTPKLPSKKAG